MMVGSEEDGAGAGNAPEAATASAAAATTVTAATTTLFTITVGGGGSGDEHCEEEEVVFELPASTFAAFPGTLLHERTHRILNFHDPYRIDLPDCSPAVFRCVVLPFYDTDRRWDFPYSPPEPAVPPLPSRTEGTRPLSFLDVLSAAMTNASGAASSFSRDGHEDGDNDNDQRDLTPARIDHDLRFLGIPSPFDPAWSLSAFWSLDGGRDALLRALPAARRVQDAQRRAAEAAAEYTRLTEQMLGVFATTTGIDGKSPSPFLSANVTPELEEDIKLHFRFDELTAQALEQSRRLPNAYTFHNNACVFMPQACRASDVELSSDASRDCVRLLELVFGAENVYFKRFDYGPKYQSMMNQPILQCSQTPNYVLDEDYNPVLHRSNVLVVGDVLDLPQPSSPLPVFRPGDLKTVPRPVLLCDAPSPFRTVEWTASTRAGGMLVSEFLRASSSVGVVVALPAMSEMAAAMALASQQKLEKDGTPSVPQPAFAFPPPFPDRLLPAMATPLPLQRNGPIQPDRSRISEPLSPTHRGSEGGLARHAAAVEDARNPPADGTAPAVVRQPPQLPASHTPIPQELIQ
ncbi:hypothetical protein DFJ73DRAFT_966307, partial [Zopfochytrium polystomum]